MKYIRYFLVCSIAVPFILFAGSCSTGEGIEQIFGKNVEAPVFLDCRPVSSTELVFTFSRPVRVVSLNFDSGLEAESIGEGEEVKIGFSRPLEEGVKITADILVEDADRNSLNVIVPFRARNDRMPALVFNELKCDRPTGKTKNKDKVEFVEFFTLTPGNLGGLRLFIARQSLDEAVYEFPPAEVEAGKYITLHLRTVEEGCVDETGGDTALSGGAEAHSDARDFWVPGDSKLLHETDILWLLDQDDRIIDAVLLSDKPALRWARENDSAAAEFLGRNKAWLPPADSAGSEESVFVPGPSEAFISGDASPTRTICRDEKLLPEPRAGNWYITVQGGATPGSRNNPGRYEPKTRR